MPNPALTDPANLSRWRTALGRKGMEVNAQLTKLLASQNMTLATLKLPNEMDPGEPPERKLRRFLDQIIAAQRRLGSAQFGLCQSCGKELPPAVFDEAPWTADCPACDAANSQTGLPF